MADGISFTEEDLYSKEELKQLISPDLQLQTNTMTEIWKMGESIISLLHKYVSGDTDKDIRASIGYGHASKATQQSARELFVMGAQYLFKVRQFFLNDTIYFTSGYTYTDKDGTRKLGEHQFSQDDMLKMIRASIGSTAVVLENDLKAAHEAEVSANLSQVWTSVEKWASHLQTKTEAGTLEEEDSKGKKRIVQYFQSTDVDVNIYFRYRTNAKVPVRFYGGIKGEGVGFNEGWLYEWVKSEEAAGDLGFLWQDMQASGDTPLAPLFAGHAADTVQGLRGGDYGAIRDVNGVMTHITEQAKYGNKRIISFVNILKSVQEVNKYLGSFVNGEITEETVQGFLNVFTDKSLLDAYSREANITIDKLTEFLQKLAK